MRLCRHPRPFRVRRSASYSLKFPSNHTTSLFPSNARMCVAIAIEEPAIVRDHHRAAGEVEQRLLERAQRVDVEIVRRLVEQQHVAAALQQLREMQPVALATGEIADLLLLIGAAEVELRADTRAR